MELKDLIGEHVLTGVDFGTGPRGEYDYEDPNTMTFVLDVVAYRVTEDPDDGYRSSMREIAIVDGPVSNTFQPVRVVGRYRTDGGYGSVDAVLELVDVANGNVILTAGTTNTDDYYPCFEAAFRPELMSVNGSVSPQTKEP